MTIFSSSSSMYLYGDRMDGGPSGRPPRLSHSSWVLLHDKKQKQITAHFYYCHQAWCFSSATTAWYKDFLARSHSVPATVTKSNNDAKLKNKKQKWENSLFSCQSSVNMPLFVPFYFNFYTSDVCILLFRISNVLVGPVCPKGWCPRIIIRHDHGMHHISVEYATTVVSL